MISQCAGLPTKEPVWQKEWEEAKIVSTSSRVEWRETSLHFHDGPYAMGAGPMGHTTEQDCKWSLPALSLCRTHHTSQVGIHTDYQTECFGKWQSQKRKEMDFGWILETCCEYALVQADKNNASSNVVKLVIGKNHITLTPWLWSSPNCVFGEMATGRLHLLC